MSSPPRIAALIVAAGQGSRAGEGLPKQYRLVRGLPMLRHSYAAFADHPGIASIHVVIGEGQEDQAAAALAGLPPPHLVTGGATRRASVRNGLEAIEAADNVLIHDAARPFLSKQIIDDLIAALEKGPGAVPALPVVDSLARGNDALTEAVDRDGLWRIQTPQAFHYDAIRTAHRNWTIDGTEPTDDARMLMAIGGNVDIVPGDERLAKYTFSSDFEESMAITDLRSGTGFDVHRLVSGEELRLCGVLIPHSHGLAGHSDADVAIHALVDAILGALALGDIGTHFPPSDPQWKGASSDRFLAHAAKLVREAEFELSNCDVTIICEAPKIGPHKQVMREKLAEILDIDAQRISVKATTTEMLGFTGRGEGIAAQAIATLIRKQST